jgi:DNA-binding PadR family transcriptional regulator
MSTRHEARREERGWIDAERELSGNSGRARFYSLPRDGRQRLPARTPQWQRLAAIIGAIPGPEEA